jgi:hypothetical protein
LTGPLRVDMGVEIHFTTPSLEYRKIPALRMYGTPQIKGHKGTRAASWPEKNGCLIEARLY